MILFTTGAISHHYAYFGRGSGPVFMRNVRCSGSETHLVYCTYSTTQHCTHNRDFGVECPGALFFICVLQFDSVHLLSMFLQFPAVTHALPMVTFVLLEEETSMRVEWRSATMDNGELFVMTHGVHQMPRWPVDSLATQE